MEITVHFWFNLSLLIVLLFLCLLGTGKSHAQERYRKMTYVYFTVSLVLCYLFSYKLSSSMYLDLRNIPVIAAGFYTGYAPLFCLMAVLLRAFYGVDTGFFLNILLYAVLGVSLWRLSPWFLNLSSNYRVALSSLYTLIISFLTMIFTQMMFSSKELVDVWFAYMVIPPLGVGMISYFLELIDKNMVLREHVVKTRRLEAVEQMGAAISHEIRNPLTTAMGFVQLLQEEDTYYEKRTEYLSLVKSELESAERVIQDYLTFSKPSIVSLSHIYLHDELHHVIKILHPFANQYSVEITEKLEPVSSIYGDRQKIRQCFLNLVKNAIESMPSGGQLTIESIATPLQAMVRIEDSGVGMTKHQMDRLGEPYYSTKGSKGTGLGMMVVYSIVRAMKGNIKVHSKVGKGTVFILTFPIQPESSQPQNS
ncbi:sensor histidine kinase [Fictibacillus terranigra]|uniref:histidine kinase n=1 Tax=Fictibacillus terranigra TaxID=3058424 RepID=A0ABT8E1Y0_9BACL|nr:HAMP domain-containing sensor histidine kinase [Fictibacillus sp. CENA-BCM004]MDN4071914.1 HAMP domain-containing sensor histidine kinase [Fictibacillus sp. CENA-BCM004]